MTARPPRTYAPDFLTEMFRNPLDVGYAQAAVRRAQRGPVGTRQRILGRAVRTLALVAAGFLLATAYVQTAAAQPASSKARASLIADVKSRQSETDKLQQRADALRDEVNRLRDAALADTGVDLAHLRDMEARVGLGKVHGGGAVVTLADAPRPVDPVTGQPADKNYGQVLDRDLQDVSNELWRDGAEAIAINGERLTSTSTIRTAGSAILVDFKPVASPYEIQAIGPGDLDRRFDRSDTGVRFRGYATSFGMQVSVEEHDNLTLPAAADPRLRFAQPILPSSPNASPTRSGGR